MNQSPFMVATFPRAIIHVDGDAFFTSVEQALDPRLRGKPVVTGKERGIIACASYEAKTLGIKRGIMLSEARKLCPGLIILPSDYEAYGIFSRRMFNIMRTFTPIVEEYSIDEAFADISGMRRVFRCSYEEIARRIQAAIRSELGITVSIGLSLSKSLAKLCSKFRKPRGFTSLEGRSIHLFLQQIPLENVWGFGPNTTSLLQKLGLRTAHDFACRPVEWAARLLGKPGRDIWNELRGHQVWKLETRETPVRYSIIKSLTFTPASGDPAVVYAELARNVESAFRRARLHQLKAGALGVVLRRADFQHDGVEARLNRATACEIEALPLIRELFEKAFSPNTLYRATLIALGRLEPAGPDQFDLFEDRLRIDDIERLTAAIDTVNRRYGSHTLGAAAALFLQSQPASPRRDPPERWQLRMPGETIERHLALPRMDISV